MTIDTSAGVVIRKRIYLDDLDGFGMLHHARYALLFDNAVIDYWTDAGWTMDPAKEVLVIKELTLEYHAPVLGMTEVDVHFWVDRAGRSSVTYRFEVLSADHTVLHSSGSRVVVFLDGQTLRPTPIPADIWDKAGPLLAPGIEKPAA
ncbi:acyl-CoA thioester hydrolase [Nocardioides thalensis]|uniref:Acyl-CoA thioester hydrolase n=1 Tax=Nocardioides thalensis TaxID=1914755 RepID=A0A853C7L9_9ACTN|nr:thioesterase family protein [Nocardioides thalensis]NYJ02478.1 acyl-CoA thioester hydrolase [Nocardioides thalensis]